MIRFSRSSKGKQIVKIIVIPDKLVNIVAPKTRVESRRARTPARGVTDFREILHDKSIDVVCIATPDHWHAYMTVEACKNGKDVYVEKPICVAVEEGRKMVQAARKYNRVVQAGTMQRSGDHFQKACDIVRSGKLGKVTFVRTWNYSNEEGIGNPPDGAPVAGLDWEMWLGPAPEHAFNANRFGVDPNAFSHFRWFWDYAGGMMTDWGIHLLDIVQMAFDEAAPTAITALGEKLFIKDNRDTPDTLQVTYEYPGFIATYENRLGNANSMFKQGYGILFHGSKGTMFVDRSRYDVYPEKGLFALGSNHREEQQQRQHGALGELPRLREDAPEADQRYRDRASLHHDRAAGQRGAAQQAAHRLGSESGNHRAGRCAPISSSRIPLPMETGSLMINYHQYTQSFHLRPALRRQGFVGLDHRFLHAIVDDPEKSIPDLLRLASRRHARTAGTI